MRLSRLACLLLLGVMSGCASADVIATGDGSGSGAENDTGAGGDDTATEDTAVDTATEDTGAADTAADTLEDTAVDTALDTAVDDTTTDTDLVDTTIDDTTVADTSADTTVADTDPTDTATGDTTIDDTTVADIDPADTTIDDTGTDTGSFVAVCGNGTVEEGEVCDDGNRLPNDGCDINCQLPATGLCSTCTSDAGCPLRGGLCLALDNGDFCSVGCGTGCPGGFSCQIVTSVDGFSGRQCLPATNTCGILTCPDVDGDRICDARDICLLGDDRLDVDGDGIPDACDIPIELCDSLIDEDGDGAVDCDDPDCDLDPVCAAIPNEDCFNGIDDDFDGATDCADSACLRVTGCVPTRETSCTNSLDDDFDGSPDCADADCASDVACRPAAETSCVNATDDDFDGLTDCADADCARVVPCVPATETNCTDRIDNDIDGLQDCNDPDCTSNAACGTLLDGTCGAAFRIDNVGTFFGDTTGSDNTSAGISCTGGIGNPDEAWDLLLPRAGTVCIDTIGSSMDTVLYLRDSCPGTSDIACNDDTVGLGNASRIQFFADADTRYFINVDSYITPGPYILRVRYGSCTSLPAPELCADRTDNDGDGAIDCADSDCRLDPGCIAGVSEAICDDGRDDDGDGTIDCNDLDCFGRIECTETCNDGIDNDRDGYFDCYDSVCLTDARCNFSSTSGGICESPFLVEPIDPTNSWNVNTVGGFDQTTVSCGLGTTASPDVVFAFQPFDTSAATYCFDTTGSDYDTVVEARTRCTDTTTTLRCEDDTAGVQQTRFTLNTTPGVYYYLIVSGFNGASGNLSMAASSGPCF